MAATVEFDLLPADKAQAIDQACDEIISGKLHEHFVVDLIQGGAGTSTNINANDQRRLSGGPLDRFAVRHVSAKEANA